MSNLITEAPYPYITNEPTIHSLVRRSFAFVPSAGMRLAPEILLIELYREVFYEEHSGATAGHDLDPDEMRDGAYHYSIGERAVLHALRGRRKKYPNTKSKPFFAPAFPQLAENAWLGKKRERVIVNFLLGGAIAQHLWLGGETEQKRREHGELADQLVRALAGQNSYRGDDPRGKDILSVALGAGTQALDESRAKRNILQKTEPDAVMRLPYDTLSQRIFHDLSALCTLEVRIPRMQWLQVLMTFLRFSLPIWLLAHMHITSLLHSWLLSAIDGGSLASPKDIEVAISHRNRGLLHPTLAPTREILERTEEYMKHRVELSILLYRLESAREDQLHDKRLEIGGAGSGVVTVDRLLSIALEAAVDMKSSERFRQVAGNASFQDFLTREAEMFPAWRDPLNKGQGKNIDEFFRVLYRDNLGDEAGGYLLVPELRPRRFRVFPGQLLLKTVAFLAAHEKQTRGTARGGGRLVLEDVEDHFGQYGIDFSSAADARPLLVRELQALGLLSGSPDAGGSVAVAAPY